MLRMTLAFGAMVVAMANPAVSQTRDAQPTPVELARLDGFIQGLTQAGRFSGVVLVARSGNVMFEKAYGTTDPAGNALATTATRYNLASVGKMFTSVAILQQIAARRITLESKVGDVIKDYPDPEFARLVTVRQLLTHTSGAGDIDLFGTENAAIRAKVRTPAQMVAAFGKHPPAFPPGSQQEYGNFAYVVLGRMVEVLSGEDYESYVTRHIFSPAGMTRTGFVDCTAVEPDIAVGLAMVDSKQVSNCQTQPLRGLPAGGQLSTAGDMFRFVNALQEGGLVPKSLLAEATRPYRAFMGLGFFSTDYTPDHPRRDFRWGHAGSTDGACTDVRTYPHTGETVIVLSNRDEPYCFAVAGFLHRQFQSANTVR